MNKHWQPSVFEKSESRGRRFQLLPMLGCLGLVISPLDITQRAPEAAHVEAMEPLSCRESIVLDSLPNKRMVATQSV